MHIIEYLYTAGVIVSILATVPQLKQVVTTKASDEFSLSTWIVWLSAQAMTLVYVISINNALMITANTLWVAFYAAMVYLIIHYRHFSRQTSVTEPVDEEA